MKWHVNYYKPKFIELSDIAGNNSKPTKERNDAIKERSKLPLTPDGNLTSAIKKQILLNNIYGVDIDTQAVEVTKLSLLLKCMEGETSSSINAEMRFGERILPTLDSNIKSGNSLVDLDYYDGEIDFEPGTDKKVKPFSWEQAFPNVFKQGGFDSVIGNPPYVRQELLGTQKQYFQKKYKVYHGMADLYSYFFEKGIGLLKPDGLFGIIVANKWMRANYGEPLRRWMKEQDIKSIVDFGDLPVFQNATTYPCIIIASQKTKSSKNFFFATNVKTLGFASLDNYIKSTQQQLNNDSLKNESWNLGNKEEQELLRKIKKDSIPLGEYAKGKIFRGVLSGLDEAFVINDQTADRLIKEHKSSSKVLKPYQAGKDIKRYQSSFSMRYLIFLPKGFTNKNRNQANPEKWFNNTFPAIANHLKPHMVKAEKRFDKGDYWWEMRACEYYEEFSKPKISYLKFQVKPVFTFDNEGYIVNSAGFIMPIDDKRLLGILNSKLGWYLISNLCTQIQNGYQLIWEYFKDFPIKQINSRDASQKLITAEIENHVSLILNLNKEKTQTNNSEKKEQLQQRIQYTDDKINQLVYELYELTEEEIKMVEGV